MSVRSVSLAAVVLGGLGGGCAPATVHVTEQPIIGGTLTTDDPGVVLSLAQIPGAKTASLCTGIVASPHVVLTAAHCVAPSSIGEGAVYAVYFDADPTAAANPDRQVVTETHYDPGYDPTKFTAGHDVGALILPTAFTGSPVVLNRTLLSRDLIGEPAILVGYGESTASDPMSAAKKRTLVSSLVSYDDKLVDFGMAGATACDGDSGGPATMTIGGEPRVVGLVSFGNTKCDATVSYSRVDEHLKWFDDIIDAADPGFLTDKSIPHHGCSTVPGTATDSPPVLFGLALLAVLGALGRKRRQPLP
ncbi:MAG: trypsin-like serine protease [Polyangia bacterium]